MIKFRLNVFACPSLPASRQHANTLESGIAMESLAGLPWIRWNEFALSAGQLESEAWARISYLLRGTQWLNTPAHPKR